MNEETKDALLELRRRIAADQRTFSVLTDEFGKGVEYAFTTSIIEIDRMLDEENE